jgi:DNA-binding NarL/FixJ family response regulator
MTEKKGNSIPDWKVSRILKLEKEGLKRVEIVERLQVCDETVRKYIRQAGGKIHMIGMAVVKARREGGEK